MAHRRARLPASGALAAAENQGTEDKHGDRKGEEEDRWGSATRGGARRYRGSGDRPSRGVHERNDGEDGRANQTVGAVLGIDLQARQGVRRACGYDTESRRHDDEQRGFVVVGDLFVQELCVLLRVPEEVRYGAEVEARPDHSDLEGQTCARRGIKDLVCGGFQRRIIRQLIGVEGVLGEQDVAGRVGICVSRGRADGGKRRGHQHRQSASAEQTHHSGAERRSGQRVINVHADRRQPTARALGVGCRHTVCRLSARGAPATEVRWIGSPARLSVVAGMSSWHGDGRTDPPRS